MMGCVLILLLTTLFAVTVSQLVEITADKMFVKDGERVVFTCKVPDFTDNVFVKQGSNNRAVCFANNPCSSTDTSAYTVTNSGTTVIFTILSFSKARDEGSWIVSYGSGSDSNPVVISEYIATLFVLALYSLEKLFTILTCMNSGVVLVGNASKHCYRIYKRKSLKEHARLLSKSIMACHGDEIIFKFSHRVSIIPGNTENVRISSNDTVSTLHITEVTEQHFGVYKCGILLESIDICKEVKFDYEVITKRDNSSKGGKEIKIEFHFEVDNEDLVTLREPRRYYFADKYNVGGLRFTGIQIIIGAAIYQLMSILSTFVVLVVVFYAHREYDTAIVIPVAVAMAVLFPLLGIGVYMCTVKCCRKLKKDTDNALKTERRCVTTVLLFIITILPVAWFVLFVMIVINKCRQPPVDGNDDKTIENQSTDEETKENNTNGIRLLPSVCCQNSVDAKEDAKEAVPLPSKSIWDNNRKAELPSITADAKANTNVKQISMENEIENQGGSHHAVTLTHTKEKGNENNGS